MWEFLVSCRPLFLSYATCRPTGVQKFFHYVTYTTIYQQKKTRFTCVMEMHLICISSLSFKLSKDSFQIRMENRLVMLMFMALLLHMSCIVFSLLVLICICTHAPLTFSPVVCVTLYATYTVFVQIYLCVAVCQSLGTQEPICRWEGGMDGVSVEACGRQAQGT